jgi:hypothetical protein
MPSVSAEDLTRFAVAAHEAAGSPSEHARIVATPQVGAIWSGTTRTRGVAPHRHRPHRTRPHRAGGAAGDRERVGDDRRGEWTMGVWPGHLGVDDGAPHCEGTLAAVLPGLGFGVDPKGRHNDGTFMLVIDPRAFSPTDFKVQVEAFVRYLKATLALS